MKKGFKIALVVLLMMGLVLATGCSSNDGKEKVYYVGTEPTFPPFEFQNEETGEITGFDIDLIKAIAEDQGLKVEIQSLGFDALVPALQSGNIDIAASGMSITEERLLEVDFTDAYIDAGLVIAVSSDNEVIKGEEDLEGKVVAVQIGTTGAAKAQEFLDAGIIKEIKTFNTVDIVMLELINGGVDAVINDKPVTEAYMAKQEGKIKIVGDVLESDSYGYAIKKGNTELLEKLNAGLKNVIESGKFAEIQNKYFSGSEE